jgi:hypothetical protein
VTLVEWDELNLWKHISETLDIDPVDPPETYSSGGSWVEDLNVDLDLFEVYKKQLKESVPQNRNGRNGGNGRSSRNDRGNARGNSRDQSKGRPKNNTRNERGSRSENKTESTSKDRANRPKKERNRRRIND